MRVTRENIKIILLVLLIFGWILLGYRPLLRELAKEKAQMAMLGEKVHGAAARAQALKALDPEMLTRERDALAMRIPMKEQTALIIDELTRVGKSLDINFTSITPKNPEKAVSLTFGLGGKEGDLAYQRLPIELELVSGYRNLGEYLNALDNLTNCLVTVRSLEINKGAKKSAMLDVKLVLDTYTLASMRLPDED